MMDAREDRFDEMLRDAARDYNAPPATPRAEMWARIAAARADSRTGGQADGVLPLRPPVRPSARLTARPTVRLAMAIAAVLVLGVAIGRLTAPGELTTPAPVQTAVSTPSAPEPRQEGPSVAAQVATSNHLSRVETFLTEFGTAPASPDFSDQAKDLLGTTRLLLESKRVVNARTRALLEDLELVLVQIATLNPKDRREDLDFIADGLAQNQLRTRLRNAIPAGPAIRL
jgi:hypothetical protein